MEFQRIMICIALFVACVLAVCAADSAPQNMNEEMQTVSAENLRAKKAIIRTIYPYSYGGYYPYAYSGLHHYYRTGYPYYGHHYLL